MQQTSIFRIIAHYYGWLYFIFLCFSTNHSIAQSPQPNLSPQAEIGKLLFFEPRISASGKLACATCHDPSNAHAPNNNLAVQVGGIHLDQPHFRAVPSLRYLAQTPAFHIGRKNKPVGGFNRDASANSLGKQAEGPLLSPIEMANSSIHELIMKVKLLPYIKNINSAFSLNNQSSDQQYFDAILTALERYQKEDHTFQPFTSKFDFYLKGKINLSSQELRGFEVFNNPRIGNCASCHSSQVTPGGQGPLFTDFSYDALGVPRNMNIVSNQKSAFFDMGLCQSEAGKDHSEFCGMFKTPTLRNVATRKVFFHNGKYTSLREAIRFYATRDTDPEKWYGRNTEGGITKFNDLPKEYRDNVSRDEVPYDQHFGRIPRISEADIADLEAFLTTLTDGYRAD